MNQFFKSVPGAVWVAGYSLLAAVLIWQFGHSEIVLTVLAIVAMLLKSVGVNIETPAPPVENSPIGTRSMPAASSERTKTQKFLWG